MTMRGIYLLFISAFLLSCNATPSSTVKKQEEQQDKSPVFKMVSIPSILATPEERAEYLVKNYWNNFDFSDTIYVDNEDVTEQVFVNYIDILPHTNYEIANASIKKTIEKASTEKKMVDYFFSLYEKYFYDANSPMRNDELFIPVLEGIIASPAYEEAEKIRPQNLLHLALKNRVGEKANDFTFTLKNGQKQSLYKQKAKYLLVYFYNPGCPACKETSTKMKASQVISSALSDKTLKVLAVYPDEDLEEWKKYLNDIPENWISGYDQDVYLKNEEIYDLKAIPTLYFLDQDKKVIFKDANFEQIEAYLLQNKQ